MSLDQATPDKVEARTVPAVFGRSTVVEDPVWEWQFAAHLKESQSVSELASLYSRYRGDEGKVESQLRRIIFRAMCKSAGHGLRIEPEIILKHPETMQFGNSVFIGAHTMIQGRYDGHCSIGNHVWIGPHAYFDARDLILEDYVGWGPGAKVLGSSHTGLPLDLPVIATELTIKRVVVGYGADIGMNATILPGVEIGAHSIVGAGAVVTSNVPEYAVVVGAPARVLRYRNSRPADCHLG
jgi:acetyltransferase-like isoleucine patch superfamily enzyme